MTIEEQIYKRFMAAICRLKDVTQVSNLLLTDISSKYLSKKISSETKLIIKLKEQDFLVQVAIITALMEASDSWKQFEELNSKQKVAEKQIEKEDKIADNYTDFDKLLVGVLKVLPPDKKVKHKNGK